MADILISALRQRANEQVSIKNLADICISTFPDIFIPGEGRASFALKSDPTCADLYAFCQGLGFPDWEMDNLFGCCETCGDLADIIEKTR